MAVFTGKLGHLCFSKCLFNPTVYLLSLTDCTLCFLAVDHFIYD